MKLRDILSTTLVYAAILTALIIIFGAIHKAHSEESDEFNFIINRSIRTNDSNVWNRYDDDTVLPNGILSKNPNAEYGDDLSAEIIRIDCSDYIDLRLIIHEEDNIENTIRSFIPFKIRTTKIYDGQTRRLQVTLRNGNHVRYQRRPNGNDTLLLSKSYRDRKYGTTLRDLCRDNNGIEVNAKINITIYDESIVIGETQIQNNRKAKTPADPTPELIEGTEVRATQADRRPSSAPSRQRTLTTLWGKLKRK